MSSPRTFFNACLGLTLILPLFFVDLEAIGLVVGKTAGNTVEASSDDVRANLKSIVVPPPESQMTPASGQHLLLDLEGGTFEKLDDEEYLRNAILTIIKDAQMSLLGIQSAKLNPQGVSVVAMLAESHLSIHTWPEHGSALVDLFTCGDGSKLHYLLDNVVDHFTGNLTASTYSIVPRGTFEERHHVNRDIQFHPLEIMAVHKYKNKVFEVKSEHQLISVYDHHDTLEEDFERDTTRSLFLDGELQSNVDDEEKYHETLVHPAFMASSTPPERVLIIGGGIGGALRESLKYKSVKHVDMVDIDPKVIEVSREYLPSYSNCTGFGTSSCFDDPRAHVYTEDYLKWFENKVGNDICKTRDSKLDSLYDVIILDMVDPEFLPKGKKWANNVYSEEFFSRMACALNDEGVISSNFGSAPEAPFRVSRGHQSNLLYEERAEMFYDKIEKIRNLSVNFQHTRVFDAAVPAFRANWAYALGIGPSRAAKKGTTSVLQGLKDFEGSAAFINGKIKDLLLPSARLAIYSGSIHHGYQYPTGDWKGVYCVKHPEHCEDPVKLYQGMSQEDRSVWHPVTDTVRAEIASIA